MILHVCLRRCSLAKLYLTHNSTTKCSNDSYGHHWASITTISIKHQANVKVTHSIKIEVEKENKKEKKKQIFKKKKKLIKIKKKKKQKQIKK